MSNLEVAVRSSALGVDNALRDTLAVEVRQPADAVGMISNGEGRKILRSSEIGCLQVDEVEVLKEERSV